ncbi:Gfo/Idh/MocA family oxidoreductase [Muricauda sp. CAU 1633]|uniref:putative oxidoreductase C-terminal domain-containing protein n=1 Tax=Allomuricauda sp. CAU 1633 TaxID=2816036 RepID=UPI001A8FFD89|nr:putative oxidoreductase C-terminal domain-containing protein [Muricauda sp. CAU 1633]MBO0323204.1 Gfo/Idh/MocA family oxidoreductase [Muricauda sp. CAU 1633]
MKLRISVLLLVTAFACNKTPKQPPSDNDRIRLVTVDPGHFHAALVQKNMYPLVDSTVHVYAPDANDVDLHLKRIEGFNTRADNPTKWKSEVYRGSDFWDKMLSDKSGNVVVLAGNNQKKTEYINQAINAGMHVLADKPMAIDRDGYKLLLKTFERSKENGVLLYDIMTERYEITSILQRELTQIPEIFGEMEKGSPEHPAITKESVHHFYKYVSGNVLVRPPWFFDVEQEGNGLVDVTTHLVDLVQWQCFPEQLLDTLDIEVGKSSLWATKLSSHQFKDVTNSPFPDYLAKAIENDTLSVNCNGEINFKIKDLHARVSVIWDYKAPEGGGDTHFSTIRGTKANLIIRQGKEQDFKPVLYIEPVVQNIDGESVIEAFDALVKKYPGIALKENPNGWEVMVPNEYRVGHEAHFSQVTEKFIEFWKQNSMPAWELNNMISKYYITTMASELAK